jgi:hypothetical protein
LTPPWDSNSEEARTARLADLDAFIEKYYTDAKRHLCGCAPTVEERMERAKLVENPESDFLTLLKSEEDWKRWNFKCRSTRHLVLCLYCDVPLDVLHERLDKRFAVNHEEWEAERVRFDGIYNYYKQQTTEDKTL